MSTDRVASVSVDRDLRLLNKLLHMTGSFTIEFIKGKSRSNPYSIEDAIEFIDRVRIENLYDAISISKVDISEIDILCMDDIVVDNNTMVMDTIDYKYDESYSNITASDDEVVEYSEYADRIHVIERKACRSIKRVLSSSKVITDDTSNTKLLYTIIMLLFIISISIATFITIVLIK
jgi:hypothetical protein